MPSARLKFDKDFVDVDTEDDALFVEALCAYALVVSLSKCPRGGVCLSRSANIAVLLKPIGAHWDAYYLLDAASIGDVVVAGGDQTSGEVDRLLAGAAHLVELGARDAVTPAGDRRREEADVEPLLFQQLSMS